MSVNLNTPEGQVAISNEVIATVVGGATAEVFGVVGVTSQNAVRDNVRTILRQENIAKGIVIDSTPEGFDIDVNIVVSFGIKISEVARNVQERVQFNLEAQLGLEAHSINVYIQDVRRMKD